MTAGDAPWAGELYPAADLLAVVESWPADAEGAYGEGAETGVAGAPPYAVPEACVGVEAFTLVFVGLAPYPMALYEPAPL